MLKIINTVKIIRLITGESQGELAEYIGCSRQNLCQKENGKLEFSLEEANKISEKYGIPLELIANPETAIKKISDMLSQ